MKRTLSAPILGVACVLVLLKFLPTQLQMPGNGPDASWAWAVNHAAALGLRFGHDIAFTYGPYGALISGAYEPALRGAVIAGGAILGAAFAGGLAMLDRPFWALAVALGLGFVEANDTLGLLLPVPAMLAGMRLTPGAGVKLWQRAVLGLTAVALGLLPLTKLSLILPCLAGIGVLALLLWRADLRRDAAAIPAVAASACLLSWLAAGQHVADLPDYARHGAALVAGYNDAMTGAIAWSPDDPRVLEDAAVALFAVAMLALQVRHLGWVAAPVWAATALLVFTAWKIGVVRQDIGHASHTLVSLGLFLLLLASVARPGPALVAGLVGALALAAPGQGGSAREALALLARAPADEAAAAVQVLFEPARLARSYTLDVAGIDKIPFAVTGPADIYNTLQSRVLASGVAWSPRPVLQSYSAYTKDLAQLDRAHLLGPTAPRDISFRPEPIDGRLASLEDGLSWPALLSQYTPAGYDPASDFAWLRRVAAPPPEPVPGAPLLDVNAALGETITLPDAPSLWAWIDARPTFAGRAQAALYRVSPPRLVLGLQNGGRVEYTAPAGMVRTGFLVSPLVTSTAEFLHLRQPAGPVPGGALVRSLSLRVDPADAALWRPTYHLQISAIDFPAAAPLPTTPDMQPVPIAMPQQSPAAACALDSVDGAAVPTWIVQPQGALLLSGWAAFNLAAGLPPGDTEFAFRNDAGAAWAVRTVPVGRLDVAGALHHLALAFGGFRTVADPRGLPSGEYQGWVIMHRGADGTACATPLRVAVGGQGRK